MSDLAVNVAWQEILRETEAGNIPHCRAISAPVEWHGEIMQTMAAMLLGTYRPNHPDLLITGSTDKPPVIGDPDKPDYEGSCRWLIENIALKPMEAPRRLGVVMCADKMNKNAANSLLKLTEEPPAHACMMFLMENAGNFLPTLRSRSRFSVITAPSRTEARPVPGNATEWITWLETARKMPDGLAVSSELEAWENYAVNAKDFVLAGKLDRLKMVAGKKNLSVPLLCDMILLTIREENRYSEYILDDLR